AERHRPFPDPIRQCRTLDELQCERVRVTGILETVDGGDIRMVECREHLRFPSESRDAVAIEGEGFGQNLQRDVAIELRITRAIDLAHATGANQRSDFIGAETRAWSERHGKWLRL